MAKQSMKARESKTRSFADKFLLNAELKAIISDVNASDESLERSSQAANSARVIPARLVSVTAAVKQVVHMVMWASSGLSRIKLREAAMRGEVPGLKKASW